MSETVPRTMTVIEVDLDGHEREGQRPIAQHVLPDIGGGRLLPFFLARQEPVIDEDEEVMWTLGSPHPYICKARFSDARTSRDD